MPKPSLKSALRSLLPLNLSPLTNKHARRKFKIRTKEELTESSSDSPLVPVYRACLDLILQVFYKNTTQNYEHVIVPVYNHRSAPRNSLIRKVQKLCSFLVIFRDLENLLKLHEKFGFSPFRCGTDHMNYIHLLTIRGHKYVGMLLKMLSINWVSRTSKNRKIHLVDILKIKTEDTLESPLHLACKFDNISAFRYLKASGGDLEEISLRGWKPLDQAPRFSRSFYYAKREHTRQRMQ